MIKDKAMFRICPRILKKCISKQPTRHFSDTELIYAAGTTIFTTTGIAVFSSSVYWLLKKRNRRMEICIDKLSTDMKLMNTDMKERIDKLELKIGEDMKLMNTDMKERIDKLDIKFDGLSNEIKNSDDKINSRVDSVLLRALDFPRDLKPVRE